MRKVAYTGICAIVGASCILPIVFVAMYLESMGVLQYVLPYMLPGLFMTILLFSALGVVLAVASRTARQRGYSTDPELTSLPQERTSEISFGLPTRTQSGFFIIPRYCPHCGNPLDLQQVDWSSSRSLTCPTCYNEVDVRTT
jgi:hypothetical protein